MNRITSAVIALTLVSGFSQAFGEDRPDQKLNDRAVDSSRILDSYMLDTKEGIPSSLLQHAQCVVVIPALVKAGFIFGAKTGNGLASCRTVAGWSASSYTNISGASFGFQAGLSVTELVLVFTSQKAVHQLGNGDLTLGADAAIAIGPIGKDTQIGADILLKTEVFTYSRSAGLFAGVSIDGSVVSPSNDDNRAMYGKDASAKTLLVTQRSDAPASLLDFSSRLDRYAPNQK